MAETILQNLPRVFSRSFCYNSRRSEPMTKRLTWGILGTGNIARQFAIGVNASSRCNLRAVAAPTADRPSAFARTHGLPAAYASCQQLIEGPAIQAVYNSLPNSLHHEWTSKALKAGKHVLCEKPFATSLA